MTTQFVSKIVNHYVVNVIYLPGTQEVQSASFYTGLGTFQVVWNLVTVGGGPTATFGDQPLKLPDQGPLSSSLDNPLKVSPTQCTATLHAKAPGVQKLGYLLEIMTPAGVIQHDPSIIVSEDPVEIP